ncbi:MAG: DNA-3-methyladenine glycosylase [Ignavibacteria bacterium]|nr:DNA-3-methyladenine glycosylase [Ignavibacteria bacterium]
MNKEFYLQPCLTVARELIGKVLIRKKGRHVYAGIIVETEAYLGSADAASHSYRGKTKRNEQMFGDGGVVYVYFTYGAHFCMNVVTAPAGTAHAVLIRAVEPIEGLRRMMKNRGTDDIHNLCSGPGKLCSAMEINLKQNGVSIGGGEIDISEPELPVKRKVMRTKRVGITKNADKLYRFIDSGSPFVSRISRRAILFKTKK